MKVPKTIKTKEADLAIEELNQLAEEIRLVVSQGHGHTMKEYIDLASRVSSFELGCRKTKALQFEPRLAAYFPDGVYSVLKRKGEGQHFFRFNADDDSFLKDHRAKGVAWLANRFYARKDVIRVKLKH